MANCGLSLAPGFSRVISQRTSEKLFKQFFTAAAPDIRLKPGANGMGSFPKADWRLRLR